MLMQRIDDNVTRTKTTLTELTTGSSSVHELPPTTARCPPRLFGADEDTVDRSIFHNSKNKTSAFCHNSIIVFSPSESGKLKNVSVIPPPILTSAADIIDYDSQHATKPPTPVNLSEFSGYGSPSTPDTSASSTPPDVVQLPPHVLGPKAKHTELQQSTSSQVTLKSLSKSNLEKPSLPLEPVKKGPWTEMEDQVVRKGVQDADVQTVRQIKWSDLAMRVPGRTGKQVRERWYNHLDPSVNKGPWTAAEMLTLHEVHSRLGNQWSKIADCLPGRTQNHIKNRWNSIKRKMNRTTRCRVNAAPEDGKVLIMLGDEQEHPVHVSHRQHQQRIRAKSLCKQEKERGAAISRRGGASGRKRSASTNDATVFSSSSSSSTAGVPLRRRRRSVSNSRSSRSATDSFEPPFKQRKRTSSLSSTGFFSSSTSSDTSSYTHTVDLNALSDNINTWFVNTGDKNGGRDPLMQYFEQCPTSCGLSDLEDIRGLLHTDHNRIERMAQRLKHDITGEQPDQHDMEAAEEVAQSFDIDMLPLMMERTVQNDCMKVFSLKVDTAASKMMRADVVWSPAHLMCDPESMSFEIQPDDADWWEKSMITNQQEESNTPVTQLTDVKTNMGSAILGARVEIEWLKEWYAGKVIEYHRPQHCIQYDNGEIEWLILCKNQENGVVWREQDSNTL
jgi:hypothetical protein